VGTCCGGLSLAKIKPKLGLISKLKNRIKINFFFNFEELDLNLKRNIETNVQKSALGKLSYFD
jgi:hypothetical protein